MSRIDDLISQLAPSGVQCKTLGEVLRIKNGKDHKVLGDGDIPVYGSGGIMRYADTAAAEGPSVLIPRKGSLGNIFYVEGPFWVVDTIFRTEIDTDLVEPKFLYHQLLTMGLGDMNQAGGVPSQTQTVLNSLRIPVPPLEVQREIVRILDQFTQLEAELEAELEARRRQYDHYRTSMLNFGSNIDRVHLSEVAAIGTGSHDTKDAITDGEYVFYARGREPLRLDSFDFDENAIITAGDGVGVGKVFHFASGKYALHQRAYRIVPNERVDARYLYHYLVADFSRYLERTSVHASVTSLRRPMFLKYPVPLPNIEVQRRIAAVLDEFDTLTTSLSSGLPAEVAARRKQYEHYRDRLLTFEELSA